MSRFADNLWFASTKAVRLALLAGIVWLMYGGAAIASPDWLSDDAASQLNLGFEVLAPGSIPAPFAGDPDITAAGDSYRLYWMIGGGEPTFLHIEGVVGGAIPDYSKYDRNVQLEQNAEVNGAPAFRDLTPIYDLVYWESGGVVYSVESQGLTDETSLSLAASLQPVATPSSEDEPEDRAVTLTAPDSVGAGETASIGVSGVQEATLSAGGGVFPDSGESTLAVVGDVDVAWQAPVITQDAWVEFSLTDPTTGDVVATARTLVNAVNDALASLTLTCPEATPSGAKMAFSVTGSGDAIIDASDGSFPDELVNIEFAASLDGGRTMVGQVAESGVTPLIWRAPVVADRATVYLFATNVMGETTGECEVAVLPESDADLNETTMANVVAAAGFEPEEESGEVRAQEDEEETAEPEAPPANEVVGIPTSEPLATEAAEEEAPAEPSPTPNLTPTVRPTATIAPSQSEDGMAATIFGPEGGTLESAKGATVVIAPGSLTEQATLSIVPVADTKFPQQEGVQLAPGTGFDITIAGPNGVALQDALSPPAELRIEVDGDALPADARIYRVQGSTLTPAANTRIEGDELVISVDRFSRFVVGSPVAIQSSSTRSLLPFILAAVVVVLLMIGMIVLGGMFRPRRQRSVMSRRPPRPRSRYR